MMWYPGCWPAYRPIFRAAQRRRFLRRALPLAALAVASVGAAFLSFSRGYIMKPNSLTVLLCAIEELTVARLQLAGESDHSAALDHVLKILNCLKNDLEVAAIPVNLSVAEPVIVPGFGMSPNAIDASLGDSVPFAKGSPIDYPPQ